MRFLIRPAALDGLRHDLKNGWRALVKRPLFAILSSATLALGIGSSTAIFTLLDAILFRPMGVAEPNRLVRLATIDQQGRTGYVSFAALDLLARENIFEGLCAFITPQSTFEVEGRVSAAAGLALSSGCFSTLGIAPAIGRVLAPADSAPGAANVVVLSHDTWQRELDASPGAIGKTVGIEGEPFTIVGVASPDFGGLQVGFPPRYIFPLETRGFLPQPLRSLLVGANVFARLRRGTSADVVNARLQTLWPSLLENAVPSGLSGRARSEFFASRLSVTSALTGLDSTPRARFALPLTALLGISVLVLVVSCVNLANLLLARGVSRVREQAVRLALGASRLRLMREAAIESVLLLTPAVGAGIWLSNATATLLVSLYALTNRNFSLDVSPDIRTLMFVSGIASLGWLGFALGPIIKVGRVDAALALMASSPRQTARDTRLRRLLLVAQVAVTVVLVAAAAGFALVVDRLRATPLGFTVDGLTTVRLAPLPAGYNPPFAASEYYQRLVAHGEAIPGVQSAVLMNGSLLGVSSLRATVAPLDQPDQDLDVQVIRVSDGAFRTLQIPLLAGRDFSRSDRPEGPRSAIVSESLARRLFDGGAALGRYIEVGTLPADRRVEIVGIAADAQLGDPRRPDVLQLYLNYWQQDATYQQFPGLLVRSSTGTAAVGDHLRAWLNKEGREFPLSTRSVADGLEATLIEERLLAVASMFMAGVGLVLAATGLFGLLSVMVVSRTREIGIRMAIGGTRGHMVSLVLKETALALGAGVAVGLPLVWAGGELLASLFYGIGALNALTIGITVAVIAVSGLVASWLPAIRAASVEPLTALRSE
jgi:predicted permease